MQLTRREFIRLSALAATGVALPSCIDEKVASPDYGFESLPSLRQVAQKAGIYYGAAITAYDLAREPDLADVMVRECNLIVPENDLKWPVVRPRPGVWDFRDADKLAAFAKVHGMKMRGVPLLWYYDVPNWVRSALKEGQGEALLEEHVRRMTDRYRDAIFSWDVVNEAINPEDGLKDGLRQSPWLEALGPSYIARAFRLAATSIPEAQLVYNDYGMDYDPAKAQAILSLLRRLREQNVPVHAVGIQGHLSETQDFSPLAGFCKEVRQLGLEVLITELDVREGPWPVDVAARDRVIAAKTKQFLDIIFSVAPPKQILTWGISDRHTWLAMPQFNPGNLFGRHVRGLPLDENLRRKPMWHVLYERLGRSETGPSVPHARP
jgi:endo-1,4-beta-xylanase